MYSRILQIAPNNNYAQFAETTEYPGAEKKNNHQKATKIQQMEMGNIGHVTTEEAAGMIEMAVEGRTQREIAEETGRNLRTVNKTIRTATKQIAEYNKAADFWEILGNYHTSLEAIAERARDEYLGAPAGQADPRNAAAAITAIREDAKLLRLSEFVEEARKGKNDRLLIVLDKNGISSRKVESDEELAELRKELSPRDENREDDDKTAGVIY